ncbi:uncharacterized protein BJX67DRAFT_344920 [Aspergillus lucknowensis]|uniref:BRCT domain-containing protein n=1 Tax=Aspergillus lucknowensis TaxID=176173 RepID=A0ABR4M081_9EURO
MARAAVIPQSPPKRATRGRGAKGSTATKTASKSKQVAAKVTKAASTAELKRRNARAGAAAAAAETNSSAELESEEESETDDEIGVIQTKGRGRPAGTGSRGKSATAGVAAASTGRRGRRAAVAPAAVLSKGESDDDGDSGDEDDELARLDAPKKRAGRPKTKASTKEEGSTAPKAAGSAKPRGRPKGTTVKPTADDDILKENTRRNAKTQDSDELSSSQGPTQIFITPGSAMLRRQPKKKKTVTFQEMLDSEEDEEDEEMSETAAPTARRRRGTIVAKDQHSLAAKPVRKTPTASTRGRKPAAGKKGGAKPLSPKKATQVAKGTISSASSDGEDELNGAKDAIKLVVHSPQKHESGKAGLGSPVRRINFTPSKLSKKLDENGEPTLPHPKMFDFGDSQFMSSPARRPPPSPFHFTIKETPKRAGLSFQESTKPLARRESNQAQDSPLRTSPRKAKLGTPARGSLFPCDGNGFTAQPSFTPAQNSPLKTSPKKASFGASFSSQQFSQQASNPFKSSLLLSPAKKVGTPFKGSVTRVPSSLAKESPLQVQSESDDETVSMYGQSPLRGQEPEGPIEFDDEECEAHALSLEGLDARSSPSGDPHGEMDENSEEDDTAQSDQSEHLSQHDEDEVSSLAVKDLAGDEVDVEDAVDTVDGPENDAGDALQMSFALDARGAEGNDQDGMYRRVSLKDVFEMELHGGESHGVDFGVEHEHTTDLRESDAEEDKSTGSAYRTDLVDGLEDVFAEPPTTGFLNQHNTAAISEEDDWVSATDDELAGDEPTLREKVEKVEKNSTLYGPADDDLISSGPFQPYEIEEVEDTPFVTFLLTHWAPTLPLADVCNPSPSPMLQTDITTSLRASADSSDATTESPIHEPLSEHNTPTDRHEGPGPPHSSRGPRFTLLAEQLSRWKASTPEKAEGQHPRRRDVFSLAGRRSGVSGVTPRAPSTDIFANAPLLSACRSGTVERSPASLEVHEDGEELAVDVDRDLESNTSARQPMAEIAPDESPDVALRDATPEQVAESGDYPTLNEPGYEKENDAIHLPDPATPVGDRPLNTQTYHTVSKVPLRPEGEISPLKISRKRGRSLSMTSPVRSSPRLRNFVLPPAGHLAPESPPHKSRRLQGGSIRKSHNPKSPRKSAEVERANRTKTPLRSPSPSKTPRKQVAAYDYYLRGAVVFVDVHTTEGEDASGIFIELLQQMGARCIKNWSWNPRLSLSPEEDAEPREGKVGITHVVFKDGGIRTLEKVRQAGGLVKCVGVGWVLDCERENKWLDETPYAVDSTIIPRGGAKRRKSMEPRALSHINGTLVKNNTPSGSASRRQSEAARNAVRNKTPMSRVDRSTPETARKYEPGHTEGDQKYWQTPQTPGAAPFGFNFDSIGMSPATPFYLSQRSKLVQQTCPPKQTQQGLFSNIGLEEEEPSQRLKARLEAARRKSLAFKPAIGSPLVE